MTDFQSLLKETLDKMKSSGALNMSASELSASRKNIPENLKQMARSLGVDIDKLSEEQVSTILEQVKRLG